MPPPSKKAKLDKSVLDVKPKAASMAASPEETAMYLVFKWMNLDTVDLLLQTSKVCRRWKRASDTALLELWAPAYDGIVNISTRQEFLVAWHNEQRGYWNAHAKANPPEPRDEGIARRLAHFQEEYSNLRISEARDRLDRFVETIRNGNNPERFYFAGLPYFPQDPTSSLKSYLHSHSTTISRLHGMAAEQGDTFSEQNYWYFLLNLGANGPDWKGIVRLKSAWRPDAENLSGVAQDNCILSKPCVQQLSKGSAIQLRFDITSIPWRNNTLYVSKARQLWVYMTTFVVVVAVHKETGEASVLCTGVAPNKKQDEAMNIQGDILGRQFIVRDVKTDSQNEVESADLVVMVTQKDPVEAP
ncbi:MAG: hypothetical protein SGARI_002294 [Bacillariaceae sp.]